MNLFRLNRGQYWKGKIEARSRRRFNEQAARSQVAQFKGAGAAGKPNLATRSRAHRQPPLPIALLDVKRSCSPLRHSGSAFRLKLTSPVGPSRNSKAAVKKQFRRGDATRRHRAAV